MTPERFVTQIMKSVVSDNCELYREVFESATPQTVTDPYWQRALALYASLGPDGQAVVREIMRRVAFDTVSTMFGILDGSTGLEGPREDFVLLSQPDGETLNGDLQTLLLQMEEGRQRGS
jgi:hypothetical protein